MGLRRVLLVLVSALAVFSPQAQSRSSASLFELVEQVTEINPTKFAKLAASSVPWVLDCYSPACPHCKKFAPTWEKVGTALRSSFVQVGAINCLKHGELCRSIPVPSYPTLVALNSPGEPRGTADNPAVKVMERGNKNFEKVMSLVEAEFPGAVDGAGEAVTGVAAATRVLEQNKPVVGGTQQLLAARSSQQNKPDAGAPCALRIEDAAMSVRFNLMYEVFTQGDKLDKDQMGALLSFLDLLATTFPGKMNRYSFRSLATDLRHDPGLNDIIRWDKRIQNLHIGRFAPGSDNWPAANIETGTKNEQHYTSGLWALLHALSVSTAPGRQDPYAIMEGIHSFVANFFRCEHCRSHFLDMYDACDNGRCDIPKPGNMRGQQASEGEAALALWVWRMHNAVNVRLVEEGDEDIDPITSLWPSARMCETCWSGYPQGEGQPPWSEAEVLRVLRGTFSCPAAVEEGPDAPGRSWAVTCVLVCAAAAVVMWARRWFEMRGIGMDKKRVDARL